jgi:hypothetical protein
MVLQNQNQNFTTDPKQKTENKIAQKKDVPDVKAYNL